MAGIVLGHGSVWCRWAALADEHGDKLAVIDPHQTPATKLTYL
jgi:hypothetical protein